MVYAANEDSPFHDASRQALEQARLDPSPSYLTWNVCYEFLRVSTHPNTLRSPWTSSQARTFLGGLLTSPGMALLVATQRHVDVLAQTLAEFPDTRANGMHDLHTVVLMREHGISRICTMDSGFRRFPFLTVVEPGS